MSRRAWLQLSGCPGEGVPVHGAGSAGPWQIRQEGCISWGGGGKGNLTPEGQGAASAHPHGTGWPGECAWARAQRAEAEVRRKVLPGTQELAPHRQTPAGGLCGGLGLHLGDYPGFESVMRCGGDVTWETVPGLGARGHGAGIGGAGCRLAVGLTCSWRPQPVCGTPGTRFHPL